MSVDDDVERFGAPPSRASRIVYALLHRAAALLAWVYFRASMINRTNFPATGAVIVAPAGHRSNMDTPIVGMIAPRRLRYLAKSSLFKNRFWTWFIVTLGGFPVHRGTADREAMKAALAVLERGEPLVVFPEGARQEGPVLTEFFPGTAWLAAKSGAPVLPVGIGGGTRAMPKGSNFPRPWRLRIIAGEPMPAPTSPDGGRVPRSELNRFTAELHERLQDLYDEAQIAAGTPNKCD